MPLYRIKNKIVLFVHIPKAGGTSIASSLKAVGSEALYSDRIPKGLSCTPQHFHGRLIDDFISEDFVDFSFCVVRNPIDRVISEFFYRRKLSVGNNNYKGMDKYLDTLNLSWSFSFWLKKQFMRIKRNPFLSDNHLRPQNEFLPSFMDEIYYFEDGLNNIIPSIESHIQHELPRPERHYESSRKSFDLRKKDRDLLIDFYREDYEKFQYSLPDRG